MNHKMQQSEQDAITEAFFQRVSQEQARDIAQDAVHGCDDGELYFEKTVTEALAWDEHRLRSGACTQEQGFGLRALAGEAVAYAHASTIDAQSLRNAADTVRKVRTHQATPTVLAPPHAGNARLYPASDPCQDIDYRERVQILSDLDNYLYAKDARVRQVSATLTTQSKLIHIMRPGSGAVTDLRPLVRVSVQVVVSEGERTEVGFAGAGGRGEAGLWVNKATLERLGDEAYRQALVNLQAVPAPGGEHVVVLGSGWPGVLLHEAVGHGLEGDFNRKGSSLFSGKLGEMIAAPAVTVVDDGTLEGRRGSLNIDDEGTPSGCNVLIENGKLVGYLHDRQNARLMKMGLTGNGRRESYQHAPMPRMTNTFMPAGDLSPTEIIASVRNGIYAVSFGGGQVNITNGDFVFSCTEAYRIRDGVVAEPIKGATLIGNGPDIMKKVVMVGSDFDLDPGIGMCGKNGQSVPVTVGQPTLRIDGITVGGTA